MPAADRTASRLLTVLVLASAWAGFLVGVSFLATPVKFLAPSLSLPVALDVGRQMFLIFNRSEVVLGAFMLLLLLWGLRTTAAISLGAVLDLLILTQTFWMLPILDARVETILQGGTPAQSSLHTFYVIVECVKLALLLAIASITARTILRSAAR